MRRFLMPLLAILCFAMLSGSGQGIALATDFFLTIGGGYAPSGNQASLENNVLYFQRVLREVKPDAANNDVYFSDGRSSGHDLQVMDPNSVPKANRLMAEFFGSQSSLGLSYRNHQVPDVRGSTKPENIRLWFEHVGDKMKSGDRLVLFVTAHGNGSRDQKTPFDTTIATWNNTAIKMTEFVGMLDELPDGVQVVAVMVQCHAGGFARMIFNEGDPDKGLSKQQRCGFFATVHDRPAAGCTAEVDESSYVEYSTYFWAALSGRTRTGETIDLPDYNGDGVVSFDEAHAYTILTADTIDLPVKTSGEFLTQYSKFGDDDPKLLKNDASYQTVLSLATTTQRVVLEGLSKQLNLTGDNRLVDAWEQLESLRDRGRSRRRRGDTSAGQLRGKIASDLKKRWPELANVLNPVSVQLLTSRQREFIDAIENHEDYKRYRELADASAPDDAKRRVKFDRFLRVADNVLLAENLRRINDPQRIAQYEALVAAEAGVLRD
ncbi:MAG: hypothetical protein KDB00_20120 [Planctomycetales bacterium]|nr:hypothetical protein [Planctomycetales bacterium]